MVNVQIDFETASLWLMFLALGTWKLFELSGNFGEWLARKIIKIIKGRRK